MRVATVEPAPPSVRRAVILAAGNGNRLMPLTAEVPKCLAMVNGEPILLRALRALASEGVREVVIVIGYRGEQLRRRVGSSFMDMTIRYVDAPRYATTNNICSLWDAREYLDQDVLLLEGDVVFDAQVISRLSRHEGNSVAVAPFHPALSGTVVNQNGSGHVTEFVLGSEQGDEFDLARSSKTVNIYVLRKELLREHVVPRLCARVSGGDVHDYYETILRDLVADGALSDMTAVDVSESRWWEVDDHKDLETAEFLFLDRESQYDRIQELHGSYWRYGFTDHSYLYNLHFPPQEMLAGFHTDLPNIVMNYPVGQKELARLVANWVGAEPHRLAVANGGAELIKILGAQFVKHMSIPVPSFNEYEEAVGHDRLTRFPLDPVTFELDVDAFAESAIKSGSDTAVVVTPNNPTALSVPREDILKLARKLEEHGCRLIVDESFNEFSEMGRAASIEDCLEEHRNIVVLKSMSKVFGIAGLRLGYLLSADEEFVQSVRSHLPIWNVNGLAEAFLRAVGRYRRDFDESCKLTRDACQSLYESLGALPGIEPLAPDANFVFCKLTRGGITGETLARKLYVEHGILVKDCGGKSMPDAKYYVRIASRTPSENRKLLQALAVLV